MIQAINKLFTSAENSAEMFRGFYPTHVHELKIAMEVVA